MILLLILIVLLAIAGKIFLGMALEVAGGIIGLMIILFIFLFRRRRKK